MRPTRSLLMPSSTAQHSVVVRAHLYAACAASYRSVAQLCLTPPDPLPLLRPHFAQSWEAMWGPFMQTQLTAGIVHRQRRSAGTGWFPVGHTDQTGATLCCLSHTWCRLLQVLSEQVIHNESRIAKTRVVVNFNKPRVMQFTWGVRYQDFDQVRQQNTAAIHLGCEPPRQREQSCSA